jgi:hypothetical protein
MNKIIIETAKNHTPEGEIQERLNFLGSAYRTLRAETAMLRCGEDMYYTTTVILEYSKDYFDPQLAGANL